MILSLYSATQLQVFLTSSSFFLSKVCLSIKKCKTATKLNFKISNVKAITNQFGVCLKLNNKQEGALKNGKITKRSTRSSKWVAQNNYLSRNHHAAWEHCCVSIIIGFVPIQIEIHPHWIDSISFPWLWFLMQYQSIVNTMTSNPTTRKQETWPI